MITMNLFNGSELHCSPHFQNQPRTVGDALAEIVRILQNNAEYGAWFEDFDDDGKTLKVGSWGMAGEKCIHVYEGNQEEILPLAFVCYWFYKAKGNASDEFEAKLLREERALDFEKGYMTTVGHKPWPLGFPGDLALAFAA
jgi:hypothetical protein